MLKRISANFICARALIKFSATIKFVRWNAIKIAATCTQILIFFPNNVLSSLVRCALWLFFRVIHSSVILALRILPHLIIRRNSSVHCWICPEWAEVSNQNNKSATIEMYAPSSYNDTVTGETLSSVSEKSDSYSNEGSQPDYMVSLSFCFPCVRAFFGFLLIFGGFCQRACLSAMVQLANLL